MKYKVSKKINDKWQTVGNIGPNKWGNLQLSIKNTPEFKAMVNSDAQWLNFSLFEDEQKETKPPAPFIDDGEIPF